MRRRGNTSRRGVALLLALVAVSVLSLVAVGITRTTASVGLGARAALEEQMARQVVVSLEGPLLEWAGAGAGAGAGGADAGIEPGKGERKRSGGAAGSTRDDSLPESGEDPSGWRCILSFSNGDGVGIDARVLDLSGRLPLWAAGLPDGDGVPGALRDRAIQLATFEGSGLRTTSERDSETGGSGGSGGSGQAEDAVAAEGGPEGQGGDGHSTRSGGQARFILEQLVTGAGAMESILDEDQPDAADGSDEHQENQGMTARAFPPGSAVHTGVAADGSGAVLPVACEWLTVHPGLALNVRSAPVALLESVLAGGGVDPAVAAKIIDARLHHQRLPDELLALAASSRQAALGAPRRSASSAHPPRVPLAGASDAYGLLVTITHAGAQRRWWLVAEFAPPVSHQGRGSLDQQRRWRITERRRIEP